MTDFHDWRECYRDSDFIVELFTGASRTPRFRYRPTNPSISGSDRLDGLPTGYCVDRTTGGIKRGEMGFDPPPAHRGPEAIMPEKRNPAAAATLSGFIDSNPKTAFGAVKPGTFNTPPMPLYEYSLAHYQGALKYGHYNWREDPVSISTYINAARRHIDLYMEGQKYSSDTGDLPNGVRGVHNLAHSMTCLSIVMDAEFFGTLIDDRSEFGAADKLEEYFEECKKLQQHLMKTWTGQAAKLKAKLDETKSSGQK